MADLIKATEIAGGAVYGVRQMSYAVVGVSGKDYADALTAAAFKESVSIESAASAYSAVVRQRQRKVSDLGVVLADLAYAISTMDPKSNATDKKSAKCTQVFEAHELAYQYGINISYGDLEWSNGVGKATITYANATRSQNDVQYALDMEDNNLQQDMISLQSFIAKRDNAFSTAAQIIKKASKAADSTIGNIVG